MDERSKQALLSSHVLGLRPGPLFDLGKLKQTMVGTFPRRWASQSR